MTFLSSPLINYLFKEEIALLTDWLLYFGIVSLIIPPFLFIGVIINNPLLVVIYMCLETLAFLAMMIFSVTYVIKCELYIAYIAKLDSYSNVYSSASPIIIILGGEFWKFIFLHGSSFLRELVFVIKKLASKIHSK